MSAEVVQGRVLAVLRWVVIAGALFATLLPFYYMGLLSFRPIESLLRDPGGLVPQLSELTLEPYRRVLASTQNGGQGFGRLLGNSLLVALMTVALTLLAAIPGSYAIARLRFAGSRVINFLFLAVYLFPAMILAIPLFTAFTMLGLRGQLIGLAIVYVAQTVPVAIYMLRGYFATIPESLEEAGFVDGLTRFQVIRKISLPLAMPSVMSTALYVFMIAWNEFLFALLFMVENRDRWTVSLGLSQLSGSIEVPTTILMAGSVVITVPVIVLYLLAERTLVEGLTAGAEKG
ncbi:carbohydrate ABC transporter permease [Propionibacteriaceae bacterium Y1685]